MSATGEPANPTPTGAGAPPRQGRRREGEAVLEVCPYLGAEGGAWRSAYAAREHRCGAVQPPAALAIGKQRELCLLPAHSSCATFRAARALASAAPGRMAGDEGASLWPATASTTLVLEPARRMGALPGATARTGGQALLVGLMVLAFLVLVIARTQPPTATGGATPQPSMPGAAVQSPSPEISSTPVVTPSPSPTAGPTATPPATPLPTPAPTATPVATPPPSVPPVAPTRTYRVKAGDTLSSIAARYGTTVKVLADLNDISDPRLIKIGQVLRIP